MKILSVNQGMAFGINFILVYVRIQAEKVVITEMFVFRVESYSLGPSAEKSLPRVYWLVYVLCFALLGHPVSYAISIVFDFLIYLTFPNILAVNPASQNLRDCV